MDHPTLPDRFALGDDLNWEAPWIAISVWVELPFWLMVSNTSLIIQVCGHDFPVALHDNYFELFAESAHDSRNTVIYRGPFKEREKFSDAVKQIQKDNPMVPFMWRKCKTIVKIGTRCNEDVWNTAIALTGKNSVDLYLRELCRAHFPVLNQLIQRYRLATYDYFAFEVAPWDVPRWLIERNGGAVSATLVPYRAWDIKPPIFSSLTNPGPPKPYELISGEDLRTKLSASATPGEFELLDALNLMERGDYSGAVRRVTTAIEVVVEAALAKEIEVLDGREAARKFLSDTQTKFDRRVAKYEQITKRTISEGSRGQLRETRKLRHRIVHQGYRIVAGDRGTAQRSVDTGRWIFNWFENDEERKKVREKHIAFRSLGRDIEWGTFKTDITPEGVVVFQRPLS
jgi:hypothetical protein